MSDWLDTLANAALESIKENYYSTSAGGIRPPKSLKGSILRCRGAAVISELKFASPSKGVIREQGNLRAIAKQMEDAGVAGISILTEPKYFGGKIEFIPEVRKHVKIPILMKDFVLDPVQIDAAAKIGASAILLIQALFERGYCQKSVQSMINYAHSKGVEVLLEVHTEDEFLLAVKTDADMIGINNRDLKTLIVDLEVTKRILTNQPIDERPILSESGIHTPEDIHFLVECGARAFLVGTTIMQSSNIKEKVTELVESL